MNNQKNYKWSMSEANRSEVTFYKEAMIIWEIAPRKCHYVRVNRLNNLFKNR